MAERDGDGASADEERPRVEAALRPGLDVWRGLERALVGDSTAEALRSLGLVFVGLLAGWWLYVPVHELLHAVGCLAAGGTVSRLEIQPLYGGTILAAWIPWVVAGGEYAGRLAGFDTGGSDWVYFVTDVAPYILTIFPGVWALRLAARRARPLLFGFAAPWALAPFLSLPGDAFEIGTLAVTQLPPWRAAAPLLRGDDAFLRASTLAESAASASVSESALWLGFVAALVVGALWAWVTYAVGGLVARAAGQPAVAPLGPAEPRATPTEFASPLHDPSRFPRGAP